MDDVQSRPDDRGVALDHAGVTDLTYPIVVLDREREKQHTVAKITMSVGVPHNFKGTHMSRFIEVLNEHRGELTMRTLPEVLRDLRTRLESETARVEVRFPYFLERSAPASGATATMDYECSFTGEINGDREQFVLGVQVPVTSLCPCSKAISDYGAHNQRGIITIEVRSRSQRAEDLIWIEEIIATAEQCASAPVYPLLKREDERFVTMQAYDNPVFVEDMVRNVAVSLRVDPRVAWLRVHAVNDESIHNHGAFASVEWTREQAEIRPRTAATAPQVNVVVTCTQRKSLSVPDQLRVSTCTSAQGTAARAKNWIAQREQAEAERLSATDLYLGDHWSVVRRLRQVGDEAGLDVQVWVASAGYGLVPLDAKLKPYSATFAPGNGDSIVNGSGNGCDEALATWWDELTQWNFRELGYPTLHSIAQRHPDDPLLLAVSNTYLRAMTHDLEAAAAALSSQDQLAVISTGTSDLGDLQPSLLPCTAKLKTKVGGAMQALNIRILEHILRESTAVEDLHASRLWNRIMAWDSDLENLPQYGRDPMEDEPIKDFIRARLAQNPKLKRTPLLRELRDSGRACEQSRFANLYKQVSEEMPLYGHETKDQEEGS